MGMAKKEAIGLGWMFEVIKTDLKFVDFRFKDALSSLQARACECLKGSFRKGISEGS